MLSSFPTEILWTRFNSASQSLGNILEDLYKETYHGTKM
jgi:hypothetical protein